MQMKIDRIGPILSDRLVLGDEKKGIEGLHADHSLWGWFLRIISWICNPSCYSAENRKTIRVVKQYLIDQMGADRLSRICQRYSMSLEKMESVGSPLLSRDIAKIMTGIQDVKIEDIEELIELSKNDEIPWPDNVDASLRESMRRARNAQDLTSEVFAKAYKELSNRGRFAIMSPITGEMSGAEPTEFLARRFYDPLLADRERLVLCEENPTDSFETFVHNFVIRVIGREMNVGMLIPAPNRKPDSLDGVALNNMFYPDEAENPNAEGQGDLENTKPQFYRVSGKIISGDGMVSYILMPATSDTDLKPMRFYRGTSTRSSAIDAASTMITDMEKHLGRTAFESGQIYDPIIKEIFGPISQAAGHSLGSTILQFEVVGNDDLKTCYFFNGPGLPPEEVEKFNQRMAAKPVIRDQDGNRVVQMKLIIRDTHTDIFSTVGTHHIGYKKFTKGDAASEQAVKDLDERVEISYIKAYPRHQTLAGYAHVLVSDREERISGLMGLNNWHQNGAPDAADMQNRSLLNEHLNRKDLPDKVLFCTSNEALRQTIGPCIAAVIRFIRNFFRWLCGSRTLELRGIHYGTYDENGKWYSKHVRPETIRAQEAAAREELEAAALREQEAAALQAQEAAAAAALLPDVVPAT